VPSYLGTAGFIGQFLSPILLAPFFMLAGLNGVFLVGVGIGVIWFLILIIKVHTKINLRTYNPKQGCSKQVESNIPGGPWASRPTVR
jgi:MFS family permease